METIKSKSEIILQQYLKKDIAYTEPDDFVYVKTALQAIEDAFHDAQHWISVEEELPELDIPVLIKMFFRVSIVTVAYRTRERKSKTGKEEIVWRSNFWKDPVGLTVTHWRYIELV
jgi:hypothetical protein